MTSFLSDFPSPLDADVEKFTREMWVAQDWKKILEMCDKISNSQDCKDCLRAIVKRLNTKDPLIVSLAVTLLDILSGMPKFGKEFKLQIASNEFEAVFRRLLDDTRSQPEVYGKLTHVLKKWAEGDYKSDHQLCVIPKLYENLTAEGHDFSYIFEMHYPWTFKDKYPVDTLTAKYAIDDGESDLKKIQVGTMNKWMTNLPDKLQNCERTLANIRKLHNNEYKEFKVTPDFLEMQNKLSDVIERMKNEMER